MATNTPFYDMFPKIDYDMEQGDISITENVTNIFFRIGFIKETMKNPNIYNLYEIEEGDTPEIIAEKAYRDSGAWWMILLANDIMDPQFDWPLDYKEFNNYIVEKYRPQTPLYIKNVVVNDGGMGYSNGTIEFEGGTGRRANAAIVVDGSGTIDHVVMISQGRNYTNGDIVTANVVSLGGTGANLSVVLNVPTYNEILDFSKAGIHHYEKVVTVKDSESGATDVYRYTINQKKVAPNDLGVPYQFFYPYTTQTLTADVTIKDKLTGEFQTTDDTQYTLDKVNLDANAIGGVEIYNVINAGGNRTLEETISSDMISYYTYEQSLNDKKRFIKVVKPEYYNQIMTEFKAVVDPNRVMANNIFRRIV